MSLLNLKKTLIIAEACDNHFGDLELAKKFVLKAKKSGADVIKFQHHLPEEEMLKIVPKSSNFKISLYEFLKKNALKIGDHEVLKKYCEDKNIAYLCTPFSFKAAAELNEINVDWFKVGSGEFTDLPFLKKILQFKKPVILSSGMSSVKDIKMVYNFVNKFKKNDVAIMNCTSEYPPLLKDINLGFIPKLQKICKNFIVGHSDHTNNIYTSLGAVCFGAKIIEKHVYINYKSYGPDKDVSITFDQLSVLTKGIRILEQSLGKNKKIYRKEKQIEKWAKRSLVSIKDIRKGDKLSEENLWSKRPGTGIPSRLFFKYLNKTAKKNIKKNTLIKKNQILL